MLSTGIFLKIKFSKFLQTHFTSPIPIRMKKKLPYRVEFVMDYQKMPFRSTNFITLHGLVMVALVDQLYIQLGLGRCGLVLVFDKGEETQVFAKRFIAIVSPCGHGQSNSRQFKKQGNLDTTLNEITYKKCHFGSGISKIVGPKAKLF